MDGSSILPAYTRSVLQMQEQRRKVFVDLATWDDSLLFALQYTSDVGDQVSTWWDSERGNTVGDDCKSSNSIKCKRI